QVRGDALPALSSIARAKEKLRADVDRARLRRRDVDRRVPVEAVLGLAFAGRGFDVLQLPGRLACTEGPPALALAINEVLVGRIEEGPEAVAEVKRGPLRLRNPSGIAGRSVPDEVVLQTAVEVVRIGRVCADMVELADRQRGHEAPAGAAIGRVIDAA